ncbi:MAG: FAD-dependent oxidoreductase [Oscillospiraceae bacterium]|nr:FAD-dependent oxidoreductase [Oscillospiraceae bacterium]
MPDILIIGGGPAGLAAAIQASQRRKQALVVDGPGGGGLARAPHVANYPGLPGLTGPGLLAALRAHAQAMGADFRQGLARQALAMGDGYAVALGDDFVQAPRLILATGARQPSLLPGEEALLGRGVSYCATCDGALYRGKRVGVLAGGAQAAEEAAFLSTLAADVLYFGPDAPAGTRRMEAKIARILGEEQLTGVEADGEVIPLDGLFILRDAVALSALLPGLETRDGYIAVDARMRTNLPGVFAAGDCAGGAKQVAKAVGEGCVAAMSACE